LAARFGVQRGREAVTEALAYAWEHWDRIERTNNPAGYLYRIAYRFAQRANRRLTPPMQVVGNSQLPWVEPGLSTAMERLSPMQRQVVVLVEGFEWTQREAADLLGVAPSTVQKHLERGLAKLRVALGVGIDV
jgi:DNA-directed RNA polymerase specialized sigma24 family protein